MERLNRSDINHEVERVAHTEVGPTVNEFANFEDAWSSRDIPDTSIIDRCNGIPRADRDIVVIRHVREGDRCSRHSGTERRF
jgi:hypothetical protein